MGLPVKFPNPMAARASAAHASVVFLKIREYSQQPVTEQVRLKDRLEGVLASALAGVEARSRVVLEAPDGAAVVILGDPIAALQLAQRSSSGTAVPLTVGLTHGPVRAAGASTAPIVLGDALAVADAIAALSPPGRIAATRDFREALKRASPVSARMLAPAGTHTDSRDRAYEVFFADRDSSDRQRKLWIATTSAWLVAIVAVGIAARALRDDEPAPVRAAAPAVVKPAPAPGKSAPAAPSIPAFATVRLEIKPRGEIFVDGVAKGTSPPLASLQVAPGKHTIELRHGKLRPVSLQIDAASGEELVVRHTFPASTAPPPQKGVWRRWYEQGRDIFK
jgi:hypothetical protein